MELEWLRSLYGWIRSLFCHHKDVIEIVQAIGYGGEIICGEQRTYTVDVERTTCAKCGRITRRYVGPVRSEGWT